MCVAYGDLLNVAADGWRCVDGFLRQAVCVGRWGNEHFKYDRIQSADIKHNLRLYDTIVATESHLQLIEDGCLSSVVQTHNNDFVL